MSSWLTILRAFSGRLVAPAVVLVAGAGFFFLRQGRVGAGLRALAYGESVHHDVGSTVSGRVVEVRVHVGQEVKRGEPLVVLEDRALEVSRDGAAAQLGKLRADVVAAIQAEESRVTRAELWVLKARAVEVSSRAEFDEVKRQMDRLHDLLERKLIPESEVASTRQKLSALAGRMKVYDEATGRGQAGLGGTDEGHLTSVAARLEPYRQAVLVQQAALKQLDVSIEELTVRSPADGVVSLLTHRSGDVIQPGTPLVSLVTARPRTIVAILPESTAAKVALGASAEVRRDAMFFSPKIGGRVIELAPEVEASPSRARPSPNLPAWGRRVTIELLGPGAEVLPGEAFSVAFR